MRILKRIASIILSFVILIASIIPFSSLDTYAEDYGDKLRDMGFPESYIDSLVELHKAHPKWIFEPLITNIEWQTAVNGERSNHSKQLIEKINANSGKYCMCSRCAPNGAPIIREASNWVAASEDTVKYYMDPRNFLNEKQIFQFESVSYDGTQTRDGVNAILSGTWMSNSLITYKTTSGATKQYNSTTTYADAIMDAAKDSGMSAYYLAAKIRQENGGANPTASAISGSTSPFQGIYNYYNIGAYSGAKDGLAWAAGFLKANKDTVLYSTYDSKTKKAGGDQTAIKSTQYMTWRANKGDYYYVRLYDSSYNEGKSGYIKVSDCRTSYLGDVNGGYNRPWSNPYKSIYNGAKWIYNSFKTQNTNYLQKFNVSPSSPYLHSNEYMRNVAGAASEAISTYNGYAKAGIIDMTKKFSIPVFVNMPNDIGRIYLKHISNTNTSVTFSWDVPPNTDRFDIQQYTDGQWVTIDSIVNTCIGTIDNLAVGKAYKLRVGYYCNALKGYLGFSQEFNTATRIEKIEGVTISCENKTVNLKWKANEKADGYFIYLYDSSAKAYKKHTIIEDKDATSAAIVMPKENTKYKFKVCAYKLSGGTKFKGTNSDSVSIKTKSSKVNLKSATSEKSKKIKVKWSKLTGVTGYEVMWSTSKNFKTNFLSTKVKGDTKVSTTLTTSRSKTYYYVRVRGYKTVNGKTTSYPWSKTIKVKVK